MLEVFLFFFFLLYVEEQSAHNPYFYTQCISGKGLRNVSTKPLEVHPYSKGNHSHRARWAFAAIFETMIS